MRFIHTADWHLGRRLGGESLLPAQRHVLTQLVQFARDTQPDAFVISGDLYDRAVPPPEAVQLLSETLSALHAQGIPVLVVAGNHDSAERLAFLRDLLRHQHVHFTGWPETQPTPVVLSDDWGEVHFHSVPFAEPVVVRTQLNVPEVHSFDEAMAACLAPIRAKFQPGTRHVLVTHAFVSGAAATPGSERRLTLNGDETVRMDHLDGFHYVALGHLHEQQRVSNQDHVRYAGSILKYCFDEEAQTKGFLMVELDASGQCTVQAHPLAPLRDVRRVQGHFEDLRRFPEEFGPTDDYLSVTLLDQQPVKDAITLLRQRYPNVLELRYAQIDAPTPQNHVRRDAREHGMLDLFDDFYRDVYNQTLSTEQRAVLTDILERDALQQREVNA